MVGLGMGREWLPGLGTSGWSGFSKKVPQHRDGHVTKGERQSMRQPEQSRKKAQKKTHQSVHGKDT